MARQAPIERARDELFSHIHRCGVLDANPNDQDAWLTETVEYLGERYPELDADELARLKTLGVRFCKPVISRLKPRTPVVAEPQSGGEDAAAGEEIVNTADEEIAGDVPMIDAEPVLVADPIDSGEALLAEPQEA